MVTIILHCPHCGSEARVARRARPERQTEVSLSCLWASQSRESDSQCLCRSSPRRDPACLSRTQQSARPHAHVWRLAYNRVELDQKKGAQLPPLRTTLLAPDPEDPTSITLEWDERMARLCSKKPGRSGCGLPCAARRDRWSPMRLGIGGNGCASGCGKAFQTATVLVTASGISGRRTGR